MLSHCESVSDISSAPTNDFSSMSPSVYIAYHQLQAFISCPGPGYIARGNTYNTTIAYAPEALSASISARDHQTCAFSEINYTKLANYPFSNATDFILSLPGALASIDQAWSTCVPASYGAFDPPSTMQKATALTDPASGSASPAPATPGRSVGAAHGPETVTSSATSSGSQMVAAASRPAAPRTTGLHTPNPVDPAPNQGFRDPAEPQSSADIAHSMASGKGKSPDRGDADPDPSNASPAPGTHANNEGDHSGDEQNALLHTSPAAKNGKPNGVVPILPVTDSIFAPQQIKQRSSPATLSSLPASLQRYQVTLHNSFKLPSPYTMQHVRASTATLMR